MEKKIRILRIVNRLNIGGPTLNVAYLSKYLSPAYETLILAGNREPSEGSSEYILQELELSHIKIPSMYRAIHPLKDFIALIKIFKIIHSYKPHIVHTHAAKAGALGRFAVIISFVKPKAIFHTYHGNVFDGYFSPFKTKIFLIVEKFLAKFTTSLIAISPIQKRELVDKYHIAKNEKVVVIPLGFNLDKFSIDVLKKREKFRNEFLIKKDVLIISIIGRLTEIKNHILLINSFLEAKKNTKQLIKLFIVGDGELKESLIDYCKSLHLQIFRIENMDYLEDRDVYFLSWRKDIDYVNAGSDIIALSSLNEGTPVSIIEAMASGKPVLTTKVGGVEDFIQNDYNGLISALDTTEYSKALIRLVEDEMLREKLSMNASVDIKKVFGYKRLVADIETLYKKNLIN
jgi:glycosyltransferase involved in cell wall biosynthesis